jgi:hypothetical protein
MSKGKKVLLGVIIVLVVLLVGIAVIIPLLINIDRYRPQVAARIREQTGKPVQIGRLSLSIFPSVSIRVDDFVLGNPEGFPNGQFVKARQILAVVDAGALWRRQVVITSLELDDPVLNLLQDARGRWNFENPPKPRGSKPDSGNGPSSFTLGVISKVRIQGGQLSAANLIGAGRIGPAYFQSRDVSIELEQVDLGGFVGTPAAALGPLSPVLNLQHLSGFGPTLLFAAGPQSRPVAQGTLSAAELRFGMLRATSVKSKLRMFPKQVFFDDLSFDLYDGHASGDLSFDFAGRNPRYATNARLASVNVSKLLEAFPEAQGKMTGKMEGQIKLAGEVTHSSDPLAGITGTGGVSVRNGQLPSLQLNKNLMLLARLTNLGPAAGDPSSFSLISADLNIGQDRIASRKITVVGNGVDVDGAGSMSLAGAGNLDYVGVAKVAAQANSVSNLLAGLAGSAMSEGKLSFPFSITGTLSSPRFALKPGGAGMMGGLGNLLGGGQPTQQGQTQQPANPLEGLSDLFKKKKPNQ